MPRSDFLLYNEGIDFGNCRYRLTRSKLKLMTSRCVVFNIPRLHPRVLKRLPVLSLIKPKSQVWVAYSLESAENYPILNEASFMELFDYEMSYRKAADVWIPYLRHQFPQLERTRIRPKTGFCAAFISSPFNQSGRIAVLRELMRYIKVDSYGAVFQTHRITNDRGTETKLDTIADYKFTIAFENSIGTDYVTEKFFQPLVAGSIPVYLGAPNVDEYSPGDNAFINVADFASVRELAEFMKSADVDRFQEWRKQPFKREFLKYSSETDTEPFDQLGDLIFDMDSR